MRTKKTSKSRNRRSLPTRSRRKKTSPSSSCPPSPLLLSKEDKIARDMILRPILEMLIKYEQQSNNDMSSKQYMYGKITEVVNKSKTLLPWLTANLLKCRLRRLRTKMKKQDALDKEKGMADLITLPTPIPDHSLLMPPLNTVVITSDGHHSLASSSSTLTAASDTSLSTNATQSTRTETIITPMNDPLRKPPGRKKGSTIAAKKT